MFGGFVVELFGVYVFVGGCLLDFYVVFVCFCEEDCGMGVEDGLVVFEDVGEGYGVYVVDVGGGVDVEDGGGDIVGFGG